MRLANKKDDKYHITVASKRNKILTNKHGFAMITKGNHQGFNTIDIELLKESYVIPEKVFFK